MNDYKVECLVECGIDTLPEKWDGVTNFQRGIGLVKRFCGRQNYAIVRMYQGKVMVAQDFASDSVVEILEVYPYKFREKSKIETGFNIDDLKNISDCRAYLKAMGYKGNDTKGNKSFEQLIEIIRREV